MRGVLWALLAASVSVVAWRGGAPAWAGLGAGFASHFAAARVAAEGGPLATGYTDPAWFQQEIERAGLVGQLGSLPPSPPSAALLPLLAVRLEPVAARRGHVLLAAALAVASVALLASLAELPWLLAAVLVFGACAGLIADLASGQLQLLQLALALLGIWLAERRMPLAAGLVLGLLSLLDGFGLLVVLLYAQRREWRLVAAAIGALAAGALGTAAVLGGESFAVFLSRVLPAWLQGGIGDPFGADGRSWASLCRRLFLHEASLNPRPWLSSPPAFAAASAVVAATLGGLALFAALRGRLGDRRRDDRFALAWAALLLLLLSPRLVPDRLLLLSLTTAFFIGLLLERGRAGAAIALALLHVAINLPGLPRLAGPLAWSRLWLLLALFAGALLAFRAVIDWRGLWKLAPLPVAALALGLAAGERPEPDDGARRLALPAIDAPPDGGLRLDGLALGRRRLVFGRERRGAAQRWSIVDAAGREWLPRAERGFYRPALALDDTRLLAETVRDGRREIWLSAAPGRPPRFAAVGESPSWHPDGLRFAFTRSGRLRLFDLLTASERDLGASGSSPAFSPSGEELAYVEREGRAGSLLQVRELATGSVRTAHRSRGRLSDPAWSRDGRWLLFGGAASGAEDVFAVERHGGAAHRLTRHPAIDRAPVWDDRRSRILFVSDRGRCLACTTLFWMPIPAALRPR